jgi:hypothetical protein
MNGPPHGKLVNCSGGFLGGFARGLLFGHFGVGGLGDVAPADAVALDGGAEFADFPLGGSFKCPAAAHFFDNAFGIELRFQALEGAINGFAFLYRYSSFSDICHTDQFYAGRGAETRTVRGRRQVKFRGEFQGKPQGDYIRETGVFLNRR